MCDPMSPAQSVVNALLYLIQFYKTTLLLRAQRASPSEFVQNQSFKAGPPPEG